jgi:nitrogen fixation/metabolism regulation signal transduction histidine kinase
LESGNELAFNEPFNLKQAITDASQLYMNEAARRKLQFNLELTNCPERVVGDSKKIQTVVANLTGNACTSLWSCGDIKHSPEYNSEIHGRGFRHGRGSGV